MVATMIKSLAQKKKGNAPAIGDTFVTSPSRLQWFHSDSDQRILILSGGNAIFYSVWCRSGVAPVSPRWRNGVALASLQCRSGVASVTLWYRSRCCALDISDDDNKYRYTLSISLPSSLIVPFTLDCNHVYYEIIWLSAFNSYPSPW